jgi:hypothetical protein
MEMNFPLQSNTNVHIMYAAFVNTVMNAVVDLQTSIAVRIVPRLRRRRRALEILTHIKCTLWQRQNECHYWQPSDAAAHSIITDALMKVWAAE